MTVLTVFQLNTQYSITHRVTLTHSAIVNKPEDKIHSVLLLPENPLRKAEGGLRTQGYFKLNQTDKPLISVITVVFNGAEFLEQTIKSVINQSYDNVEYIIIDGGSTDGTINIIKENEHKIDYWISEPDRGISDAMNKGINLSKGDYLIFLNSDDYFMSDGALEKAVSFLKNKRHIYVFKVLFDDGEIKSVSTNKAFNFLMNFKMGSCHQGHICSRSLFEKIGLFDSRFKITMDYDFMLRAYRAGYTATPVDYILSVMRLVGISSRKDWKGLSDRFQEERKVHAKNTKCFWCPLLYWFYWPLYIQYRKIIYFLNSD